MSSGPDYWHDGLSAGDLPLMLRVHDRDGVRLRLNPAENSLLVAGPFDGIPYDHIVEWAGDYYIGADKDGKRRVYYKVLFEWKGQTYQGWVPSEYFAPPLDKESGRPQSSGGYRRTYGYNQVDGWADYHAGGAAQNLNVRQIFEQMGYDFGEGENPFSTKHTNLCGELAVMEALGVSLEEGFSKFAELGELYLEILKDPKTGTNRLELGKLFDAFEKQVASQPIRK